MKLYEICQEREDSFIVFPELRYYMESFEFCKAMRAEMAAPAKMIEQEALRNATKRFFDSGVSQLQLFLSGRTLPFTIRLLQDVSEILPWLDRPLHRGDLHKHQRLPE